MLPSIPTSIVCRVLALTSELHPANLHFLAEVITSCVLQAAATGEIIML